MCGTSQMMATNDPVAGGLMASQATGRSTQRIKAFDGLRGVAAFAVLIYHYMALVLPEWTANMSTDPSIWIDMPIYLLWNGPFAVALFFVLSGFVMSAAAERRRSSLMASTVARYLRLAVPAAASCLLAWVWLSLLPEAADTMAATVQAPSRWLEFTYQDDVKTPVLAAADGLAGVFVRGYSRFNNVLWTLKIELYGSLAVFGLYYLTAGRVRLFLLVAGSVLVPWLTEPSYLAFGLGAALFEAHRAGTLSYLERVRGLRPALLLTGVLLAFPGDGFHLRMGLFDVTEDWRLGEHRGYVHIVAATLLIVAVMCFRSLSALFSMRLPLWLGRISFSLYLVHVPLLYTLVAWLHVETRIAIPIVAVGYVLLALLLAVLFEQIVDAPLMRGLPGLRRRLDQRVRFAL